MLEALQSLKTSKSPGPDEMHPLIIKELASEISYPLKKLFDKSIAEGKIPNKWKLAEVKPLFKKGKKTDPGNYRPVSLTSIICKVFEKFIKDEIYNHLITNNLLSSNQFGFCSGRSCVTQLLATLSSWMESLDNTIPVDAIYLDFSKAFDTVPHKRLLSKLKSYGISGNIFNWIEDFLTNREQFVSINDTKSSKLKVTSGVPQGSVLGPTLFIYYINDLPEVTDINTKIFADDTKVFNEINSSSDYHDLQKAIDNMFMWTEEWLLKFNKNKCKVLHLGKNNLHHEYFIGDKDNKIKITETVSEKDLGVYIDPLLTFDSHISEVVKKARKLCNLIMRTISLKSSEIMLPLYKTLIRPIIEYANSVWYPYKRKHIDMIENVQRQFTRSMIGLKDYDYEERLVMLKLPSLEFKRVRGDLIETFKIIHKIYDPLTTKSLVREVPSESSITRSNNFKLY